MKLENSTTKYTCNEYRQEMLLLSLRRQLHNSDLSDTAKKDLEKQIRHLEQQMDMA